jgi:hypothetical protein
MEKDNVVDLGKFRKVKQEEPELKKEWLARVNDRYGFKLRRDMKLDIIEGGRVIETRDPTYPERQLVVHNDFMEAIIADLVAKYEPHRINDDYLFYPYTDWKKDCQTAGQYAVEWDQRFADHPFAHLQRAVHLLVEAVRQRVEFKDYPGKVGLMPQQLRDNYKDLTSDRSHFYFRIEDVAAIEGTRFKSHFSAKEGTEQETDVLCGDIDVTFKTLEARTKYLSVVLCCLSADTIAELTEEAIKESDNGSYLVVKRVYSDIPR